ncbi:MAG: transporter substrate-binding domain-containing protein [Candidatus Omnitrophica bacterium]|nr:transporter substrate-binding domain-containing protein [Candidatus Omnitrophota bacterium]MDD5487775.1 transporter substrate-binding domain-containing protein [Candidatus Omnitrophota bacterium]
MYFKRKTSVLLCLGVFLVCLYSFGESPPGVSEENPVKRRLIFGGDSSLAPYSFLQNDKPSGYNVDLMRMIGAKTGRHVQIRLMAWDKCLESLRTGTIDGLIGAPISENNLEHMDFTEPVSEFDYVIFVDADNRYVHSIDSLEGTVVAVPGGSQACRILERNRNIKLIKTSNALEAVIKLKNNEVTAVVANKNVTLYYIQQENLRGIKIVGQRVGNLYGYAIAVKKGNTPLLEVINKGLDELYNEGAVGEIWRKWFGLTLTAPFPLKIVSMVIGGVTGVILIVLAAAWMISMDATIKAKTRQIQMMSEKMVEKDKLAVLGKLAGQIAHELRTPLSIIHNSIYLLRKQDKNDEELFEKRFRVLEEKIKLCSNILESILSYSRVKADIASVISMDDCMKEVLSDIEQPEGIDLSVSREGSTGQLDVFMDFHQLYSVLKNLLLNSIQAMGQTGKLEIRMFPSDDGTMVNVSIKDTGGGIAESARNKIFNLFYSSKITGTGLGLPISKSIVEAHGGKLLLSETNDLGSTFLVQLPSAEIKPKKEPS